MDFELSPKVLLASLKRLFPHKARLLKQGPLVTLTAAGKSLDVEGDFENVWSVEALVHKPGRCAVDLVALSKPLSLYDAKKVLRFSVSDGSLRFGTTVLRLHD